MTDPGRRPPAGRGLPIFASVLLLVTGIANLIAGAHSVSGGLRAWGWVMAISGAVQLVAAAGVWAGRPVRSSSTTPP